MITDERIVAFIHSLEGPQSALLEEIEMSAHQNRVPIIRKEMESFLRVLIKIQKPENILEIGTAVGYSALVMAEAMTEGGTLTTIENYDKRIPIARENFKKAGEDGRITLLEGDAADVLKTLHGPFDFVFMDAAKGQYAVYMEEVLRLLVPGGVLVCDNVLQEGDLVASRFAVERRNRTIHKRMRQFLLDLKRSDAFETSIIPIGDGVTLSVRKETK